MPVPNDFIKPFSNSFDEVDVGEEFKTPMTLNLQISDLYENRSHVLDEVEAEIQTPLTMKLPASDQPSKQFGKTINYL